MQSFSYGGRNHIYKSRQNFSHGAQIYHSYSGRYLPTPLPTYVSNIDRHSTATDLKIVRRAARLASAAGRSRRSAARGFPLLAAGARRRAASRVLPAQSALQYRGTMSASGIYGTAAFYAKARAGSTQRQHVRVLHCACRAHCHPI